MAVTSVWMDGASLMEINVTANVIVRMAAAHQLLSLQHVID